MASKSRSGSVNKRNDRNKWEARVTIDGNRKTAYFSTEKEGWNWVHAKLAEAQRGVRITGDSQRVADFLADWLEEEVAQRVEPNSLDSYRRCVEYAAPTIGKVKLRDLGRAQFQRLFKELDGTLSRATQNLTFRVLKQAFEYAVDCDYLAKNPMRRMKAPKLPPSKDRLVTLEEWHAIEDAAFGTRWYCFIWLLASTAMRVSEILGLEWANYDAATGVIRVERQSKRTYGQPGVFLGPLKTEASRRSVYLSPTVQRILEWHRDQQRWEQRRAEEGGVWVGQGTLFCNPEGKLYFRSQAEWALGRITVRLGIEGVTPHTFRHTVLTELQELGEPTYAAQDLAGHASDRITRRVYSHATDATRRRVAEVLDRHLGGRDVELPSRWLTIDGDA